jgi:hypothetical protein
MQTVLSGGKDYQMVWMLIYNTDFLDALTGGYVSGHHRNPTTTTTYKLPPAERVDGQEKGSAY